MEAERRAELERIMGRLAEGDDAAVVELLTGFTKELQSAVATQALRRGVPLDRADRESLAVDTAFAIAAVAGTWRADGGALPWVWAAHRIGNVIAAHVGTFATSCDTEQFAEARDARDEIVAWIGRPADEEPVALLEQLATSDEQLAALCTLARRVGDRDLGLLLDYQVQHDQGDPAPAETVGRTRGLQAATVRQRVSRYRRKLRDAARADAELAWLADIPLLSGGPAGDEPMLAPVA
ncbi:MAG TPA: hypothetical protein VHA73_06515 [Acidimicrobiales bacterium]|jgi:hypothetical protein|nr:hypothetical protein [Acidimicrobiales bacterium]